ncbi:PIN domain-like partial [Lentinula edodes]|uniref:PIN domain-like partial n=1 Tax=Lentinula edodes TaxID=5353 RepID=A0A1Q3E7H4_LENED|nr:PIN domain-like partial [Lentinula edodes]
MGVAGLWPLLEPAQSVTTLTALALTKFGATSRGFRIGIDASIWFFHAEYGKEGENPELRTLFFRCAQLLSQGFLPLFVFDGPLRPDIKRGKRINKSANKLVTGMQAMIEAFGFEYRTAPGEAEAELAFLNRIGVIDGILSDDVDNFLFGAHTVIRNHSSTHASAKSTIEKAKVYTYSLPHPAFPDVDREDLIFIALCSGGDYGTGLDNCGIKISYGLARAGFGKKLCRAALNHNEKSDELRNFIRQWKSELAQELKTNASGFLPRKSPKLASTIPNSFPDIKVLLAYLRPVTSESLGRSERYDDLLVNDGGCDGWLKKDPSLPLLAEKCEFYFEWGFLESIIKRFRTVIFHGITLRIMRRACILKPTRGAKSIDLETICAHFAAGDHAIEDTESPTPEFIKDVSKTRTHESTSNTLEYRVAIDPTILVQLATRGVKGIRRPDDKDEWAEFEEELENDSSDNEGGAKGRAKKKEYPDPTLSLKVWLPAVLVKEAVPGLIETYEEMRRQKEEKKAGKGRKVKVVEPKTKARPKPKPSASAATFTTKSSSSQFMLKTNQVDSSDDDMDYDSRLFISGRPAHSTTHPRKDHMGWISQSTLPDLLSSDYPPPSTSSVSPPRKPKSAGSSSHTSYTHVKFCLKSSQQDKGKQKATTVSRGNSLLSTIDGIATPKKNKRSDIRQMSRFGSSSPEKTTPRPFPVSVENTFDEDSDDCGYNGPFNPNHIHSPAPPGPPQTPSPQKKTRKANAVHCSDSSVSEENTSPREDKVDVLNKSPRKSKDHRYPKGFDYGDFPNGEQARKTIRDIPHPSRAARAASPTPMRRTPNKSTSASTVNKAAVSAHSPSLPLPSPLSSSSNRPLPPFAIAPTVVGPIIISDSEDEEQQPPKVIPIIAPQPKSRPRPKLKAATTSDIPKSHPDHRLGRSGAFQAGRTEFSDTEDDDIPPLLRARARVKVADQPQYKVKAKAKVRTTTTTMTTTRTKTVVDIIELSDDSS